MSANPQSKLSASSPWRREVTRRIAISVGIGLVSGLGAMAFFMALEYCRWFFLGYVAGAPSPAPAGEHLVHWVVNTPYRPWLLVLVPTFGGLVSGFLVYTFAPEAEGHGTDAMLNAFHNLKGMVRTRVPFVKSAASIITLATGGSAGKEGPIAQIGSGFGSWVARQLGLGTKERRIFLLAGCAGGLGAIFRAPLGAAITSVEVLYSEDFESEAIIPCVISSVVAYSVFTFFFGFHSIFDTPQLVFHDARELIAYAILGLICAPVGALYVKIFYGIRDKFREFTRIPRMFRPALGGFGVGLIALAVPQAISGGYGYLQLAIYGQLSVGVMLVAAFTKIFTTGLTIGSGGSGGVFGPTLFIGGMLGGVVGTLGHMWFPEIVHQPAAFVLVGMAAFFAGSAKAPLGAMLMVSEMTMSYQLLPALMLVSVIAILFNRHPSIYERQLPNKFKSPAHQGELTVNVLSELTVHDMLDDRHAAFTTVPAQTTFRALQRMITATSQNVFPVLDGQERLMGLLSVRNLRSVLYEDSLQDLVVAGDMATRPVWLSPDQDLHSALLAFLESSQDQLPVIQAGPEGDTILGMLAHEDVIAAYNREISRRSQAE